MKIIVKCTDCNLEVDLNSAQPLIMPKIHILDIKKMTLRHTTPIERMTEHYNKLGEQGRISKDRQPPLNMPNGHTDILVEQLFYSYMEDLEKEYKK